MEKRYVSRSVYSTDDYVKQQIQTFSTTYTSGREKLKAEKAEIMTKQHKRAIQVNVKQGDAVTIQQPQRISNLTPKFTGPYNLHLFTFK